MHKWHFAFHHGCLSHDIHCFPAVYFRTPEGLRNRSWFWYLALYFTLASNKKEPIMADTFVIGDNHFYHFNIIRYCGRHPAGSTVLFPDAFTMNEYMVEKWNQVVKPEDKVRHVGDLALCHNLSELQNIIKRLNGRIYLVIGNHDLHGQMRHRLNLVGLAGISDESVFLEHEDMIFSHRPVMNPRYFNVHGHIHEKQAPSPMHFNACVEQHDFTPVSFDVVKQAQRRAYDLR